MNITSPYGKNNGLLISPEELLAIYFYGVDIISKDGNRIDNAVIEMYIKSAQKEVEKYLDIKLFPQLVTENLTYNRDDYYNNFPFFRTTLPVRKVRSCIGMLNGLEQIVYPEQWLNAKYSNLGVYQRQFSIVPNGTSVQGNADVILTGVSSQYGIRSLMNVPNYWYVQYETGYELGQIPEDLLQLVGLLSSIPLLAIAGDLILGAGIASQSLSVDGLSQSISSTSSATNAGYGSRIVEYRKSIDQMKKQLKRDYKGITFVSC
jgi:hypothetical protein